MSYPLSVSAVMFKGYSSPASVRICSDKTKLEAECSQMKWHHLKFGLLHLCH